MFVPFGRKALVLAALLLLSACSAYNLSSFTYTAPTKLSIETPPAKAPVKMGLYLSPELQDFMLQEKSGRYQYTYVVGKALSQGIQTVFQGTFEEIKVVGSPIPSELPPGIDVLVVPGIDGANMKMQATTGKEELRFLIRVTYNAFNRQGERLWMDSFEGVGARKRNNPMKEYYTECMKLGLEDHFSQLGENLARIAWWE